MSSNVQLKENFDVPLTHARGKINIPPVKLIVLVLL